MSMGFSRQEYWSELSCPPPGNLPNPGIEPRSLVGGFFTSPYLKKLAKEEQNKLKARRRMVVIKIRVHVNSQKIAKQKKKMNRTLCL